MKTSVVITLLFKTIFVKAGESEDHPPFGSIYDPFSPTTVNFNEIFTNSLSVLNEDSPLSTMGKDDEFHLSNLPTNLVEFRQQTTAPPPPTTTPKPRFPKASHLKKSTTPPTDSIDSTTSGPPVNGTNAAANKSVEVLPLKNTQRGVLDLLFPASRVRSFKAVFDTVRRILSQTFK